MSDDNKVIPIAGDPVVPRTQSQELAQRFHENLIWIDLRTKLVTLLHEQVNAGDPKAREQLDFLVNSWLGGSGPRQRDFVALEQKIHKLTNENINLKKYVASLTGEDSE